MAKAKTNTKLTAKTSTNQSKMTSADKAATKPRRISVAAGQALSEQIAYRAYEIWQKSGRPADQELEHWLQAERELKHAERI